MPRVGSWNRSCVNGRARRMIYEEMDDLKFVFIRSRFCGMCRESGRCTLWRRQTKRERDKCPHEPEHRFQQLVVFGFVARKHE